MIHYANAVLGAFILVFFAATSSQPALPPLPAATKLHTVSTFPDGETITVPKPTMPPWASPPMALTDRNGQFSSAGSHTYRYACVDVDNKLGPWSEPATVTTQLGGAVLINPSDFVPANPEIVAVYWSIDGNEARLYENGVGPEQMGAPFPWAPVTHSPILDLRKTEYPTLATATSALLPNTPPPAPILTAVGMPNTAAEWFYTFRTCRKLANGTISYEETARSPGITTPAIPGLPADLHVYRRFFLSNLTLSGLFGIQMPVGAVAVRLYRSSFLVGEYPIDMMQPLALKVGTERYRATPGGAHATISDLQQAMNAAKAGDTIVVDKDVTTLVPIIDRCRVSDNAADDTRAGITTTGPHGGKWKLFYQGDSEVGYLQQNRAALIRGMELTGGTYTFSDFTGGQAFQCYHDRCDFWDGLRILRTCAKWTEDHVPSECRWENCKFGAGKKKSTWQAIRIEGSQAANLFFSNTHAWADWYRSRGTYPLLIDTTCRVVFSNGLYAENGYALVGVGAQADVLIEHPFTDNTGSGAGYGYGCFFHGMSYYPSTVKVRGGQINALPVQGRLPQLWQGRVGVELQDVKPANLDALCRKPAAVVVPVPPAKRDAGKVKRRAGEPYDCPAVVPSLF